MYSTFCDASEKYLTQRSKLEIAAGRPGAYVGRGKCRPPKQQHVGTTQKRQELGAQDVAQRQLLRLTNRTRRLARDLEYLPPPSCISNGKAL